MLSAWTLLATGITKVLEGQVELASEQGMAWTGHSLGIWLAVGYLDRTQLGLEFMQNIERL